MSTAITSEALKKEGGRCRQGGRYSMVVFRCYVKSALCDAVRKRKWQFTFQINVVFDKIKIHAVTNELGTT